MMKTLIVDDERLARTRIRYLLGGEPDIEIVGECENARQAAEQIRSGSPDLLFLDVQMPRADGFTVIESIREARVPAVILVTAHEQYAVRAFEVGARDYLLKPVEESRFRAAVQRAREIVRPNAVEARTNCDAVLVRSGDRTWFVKTTDIDWIESADNYVRLHAGAESHIVRETMSTFETKLQPSHFARIHRSTIVNLERVREFRQWFNGDYIVVLKDGRELRMSRTYRDRVQDLLGRSI